MSEVAVTSRTPRVRSASDTVVRRLLLIPEERRSRRRKDVHGAFSVSMVLSGLRCLLSYVVFPIVTPLFGAAATVGPAIGIPIGALALTFDVLAVRRFFAADHRWRWAMAAIYFAVMALVLTLVIQDIVHLTH